MTGHVALDRAEEATSQNLFAAALHEVHRRCDRMFCVLTVVQWAFAVVLALALSPRTWDGREPSIHVHVWLATVFGAALVAPVLVLTRSHGGAPVTRHVAAAVQMLWSALLVHLTNGRIETHFHVFGSLAFLAFYRDWRVLLTATCVMSFEHLVRGSWWPESVYGISNPEWWRFLEHAAWAVFEAIVLSTGIQQSFGEMRAAARRQASLESLRAALEERVAQRTGQLDTSREQFRALVESLRAVPFEMDLESTTLRWVGPQAGRLLETSPAHWLRPRFWDEHVHGVDRERTIQSFRACTTKGPGEAEFRFRRGDGSWATLRCLFAPAKDRPRPTVRGLLLDVTAQHRLEEDLRQAQKLESVGRLAAGVAHEINTPTQFIGDNVRFLREAFADIDRLIGAAIRLAAAPDDTERHEAVATIAGLRDEVDLAYLRAECPLALDQSLDGIERVARIVHAMRDFAQADQAEKAAVDVNRVIRSAITVCRAEWKQVAAVLQCLDATNPTAPGFAQDLGQVVLNLVVNAAQAIAAKGAGARGTIQVRSRRVAEGVEIEVEDDGAGIPESVRPRIFEQFFTTKPVGSGTGQGLALSHRIVTPKQGGELSFRSEPGAGATFTIRLPAN